MIYTLQGFMQIVKYGISGVTGGFLQLIFLYTFVDVFGFWYIYGVILAYLVALVIVFSMQKFWTFRDYSMDGFHRQSFLYTMIAAASLILNIVSMYILVDIFHLWHIAAQILVIVVVGVLSFFLNKTLTFTREVSIK